MGCARYLVMLGSRGEGDDRAALAAAVKGWFFGDCPALSTYTVP
jgi:hypothetical protein